MSTALIDSDIIAYRCAATSETDQEAIALFRVDDMMHNILRTQQVEFQQGYLTGKDNFRKALFPDYKANRKGKEKPKHLLACRKHLMYEWKAVVVDGMEADDALGIAATNTPGHVVICSIDKDLLMIEGDHYNFVTDRNQFIGGFAAAKAFWTQMLVGDTSDNIIGVRGIGPVKAEKHLAECKTDAEWFDVVRKLYADDKRFILNCNLLWIMREKDELWSQRFSDLIPQDLAPHAKEVESKFNLHRMGLLWVSGSMESGGTQPNGTQTEPTG